eukprot:XP_765208.1 hypothetical protein [Theileria parva strain Muguga]
MLYFYIRRSNLYFVMTTRYITSPSYVMELLNKITNYLKIKPMTSNRNMLPSVVSNKSLINPNNKNEIFVDVIEKVNAKLGSDVKTTVEGQIQIKSYLKGSPSIQLYISNNIQFLNNTSRTSNESDLSNPPSSSQHLEQLPSYNNQFTHSSFITGGIDRVGTFEDHGEQLHRLQSLEIDDRFESKLVIEDYNLDSDVEMVNNVMKFIPKEGEYTILNYKLKNINLPFDIKTQLVNNSENNVHLSIRVSCNLPLNVHSLFLLKCKLPNHVNTINMSLNPKVQVKLF